METQQDSLDIGYLQRVALGQVSVHDPGRWWRSMSIDLTPITFSCSSNLPTPNSLPSSSLLSRLLSPILQFINPHKLPTIQCRLWPLKRLEAFRDPRRIRLRPPCARPSKNDSMLRKL